MAKAGLFVLLVAAIYMIVSAVYAAETEIYTGLQIKSAERMVDLSSQVARQRILAVVANTGTKPTSEFYVVADKAKTIALIQVSDDESHRLYALTPAHVATSKGKQYQYYRVDLGRSLAIGDSVKVVVDLAYTHSMRPQPAEIAQNDNQQLVVFEDNVFFTTPYPVASQKTSIKLASGNVVDATEHKPSSLKGTTLVYGPYSDRPALDFTALRVHFENNEAFLTITSLNKIVEVSHWGNVNVEEWIEMQNDGAKLRGEFSRFDYRVRGGKTPHIRSIVQALPREARDIYYRDEIGNISTSAISVNEQALLLELVPRFPLFGGWKTKFYMGFDLPLSSYLFTDSHDSSRHVLNVTFSQQFDVDAVVDQFELKVILPEGAKDIQVHAPFAVDSESRELHFTYLDTYGRPVVVLKKNNVITEHNRPLIITYRFSTSTMYQEIFLLIGAYFLFFVAAMAYVRFSLSILPDNSGAVREKVEALIARVHGVHAQRNEQHRAWREATEKVNKSQNFPQFNAETKKIQAALAKLQAEAANIINELEVVDHAKAVFVRSLDRAEVLKQEALDALLRAESKVGKGAEKIKAELDKAYNIAVEEVSTLLADL